MRLSILKDGLASQRYLVTCGDGEVGAATWDGRGAFSFKALGRVWQMRQLETLERAAQIGSGKRPLVAEGSLAGCFSTVREKDGLLGVCVSYVMETGGGQCAGYPDPGGGRGWRMSVYQGGEQVALVKRRSEPVHTLDGYEIVAPDEDAACLAIALAAYDAYASYLENDGGAAGPFAFRAVNLFGKHSREMDDPRFEARCEGELPEEDAEPGCGSAEKPAAIAAESTADRAARLAEGFTVKSGVDRRGFPRSR